MLAMPAPSRVYVSRSQSLDIVGFVVKAPMGQHEASPGRLHCDRCLVFCMRVRAVCDYFPLRVQRLLPPLAGLAVGWRWDGGGNGGSSVVWCSRGCSSSSQTPPLQPLQPVRACREKLTRE